MGCECSSPNQDEGIDVEMENSLILARKNDTHIKSEKEMLFDSLFDHDINPTASSSATKKNMELKASSVFHSLKIFGDEDVPINKSKEIEIKHTWPTNGFESAGKFGFNA